MIALFVTGTDTGVGKTTVACALLAAARARGLRTLAMKPIETGCESDPGQPALLVPADAIALERAATGVDPPTGTTPVPATTRYRFAAPLAPAVAAEETGWSIALSPILRDADRLRSLSPDLLVVEGAGGLLVPISHSLDMADLAAVLRLPLLVVARDALGTINHTLLTLEAAAARRLPVAAVVLTAVTPDTSARESARNAHEIEQRGRVAVMGRLPHLNDRSLASLAAAAETHLRMSILFS